jgi:hypothetical protein
MIVSTQFRHKQIHKATQMSLGQTTIQQTDHVLVNANKRSNSKYKIHERP